MVCQHCGKFTESHQTACPRCRKSVEPKGSAPARGRRAGRGRVQRLQEKRGLKGGIFRGLLDFAFFSRGGKHQNKPVLALPQPEVAKRKSLEGVFPSTQNLKRKARYSRGPEKTAPFHGANEPPGSPQDSGEERSREETIKSVTKDEASPENLTRGRKDVSTPPEKEEIPEPVPVEVVPPEGTPFGETIDIKAEYVSSKMESPGIFSPSEDPDWVENPDDVSSPSELDLPEGGRVKRRGRQGAVIVVQLFLVMGIVSVFFSIFTGLLFYLFPSVSAGQTTWIRKAALDVPLEAHNAGSAEITKTVAAYLTYQKKDVRIKPAGEIFWGKTDLNMSLFEQDSIQTLNNSRAIITFDPSNFLDIDENSMVTINKFEDDHESNERRSFLVMVDGNLRGRIEATQARNVRVQVKTDAGVATIASTPTSQKKAEFALKVNPDRSTSLTVFKGEAELTAQNETVLVRENQTTKVFPESPPVDPVPIPEPVTLRSPVPDKVYFYRDFPERIPFKWKKAKIKKNKYHLQIAKDPLFRERVLDETTGKTSFTFGNLREGDYHWRVSVITEKGIEGTPSDPRPIEVIRDQAPPSLELFSPSRDRPWKWSKIIVKGKTEKGAKVYVNGKSAKMNKDGSFSKNEKLGVGVNVIVVEAIDRAGNTTYVSRTVSRKR